MRFVPTLWIPAPLAPWTAVVLLCAVGACAWKASPAAAQQPGSQPSQQQPLTQQPVSRPVSKALSLEAALPDRLTVPPGQRLAAARTALDANHLGTAISLLRDLVEERPDVQHAEWGPAAYWLGQAHALRGDSAAAHAAWRAGVNALAARDRVDAALFDAYIRSVFRHGIQDETPSAADAYLRLLARAAPDAPRPVRRHMAHLVPLWPVAKQARLTPDPEALYDAAGTLRPEAGPVAVRWWRRQDPRPATPHNERIIEHLQRIETAQRQFAADTFVGYDDRGRIYVRLGAPSHRRELISQSLARSASVQSHFMPRNEYWRYRGFGRHSHYLFVKRKGRYRLAGVPDLLPGALRRNRDGSGALTALALRDLYDALTPRVTEYNALFDRVSDEVSRLHAIAARSRTTVTQMADTNFDPAGGGARYTRIPDLFFADARRIDRDVARRRAEAVPPSHSAVASREGGLPVALRTARFLNDDGTTRLEAYWSLPRQAVQTEAARDRRAHAGDPHPPRHVVRLTTRRYDRDYRTHAVHQMDHGIEALRRPQSPAHAPVQSLQIRDVGAAPHVALQWDHLVAPQRAPAAVQRAQSHVRWLDSLDVLPADGRLVLSDLVPLYAAPRSKAPVRTATGFQARPYPFATLAPDVRLGVYVEAYHLAFDANDRTRYTVETTVRREMPRGGLAGVFGRTTTETTATRSAARGRSRTAREYLEVDLSDFRDAASIVLVVRVTDTVTGQRAHRSLAFDVAHGADSERGVSNAPRDGE